MGIKTICCVCHKTKGVNGWSRQYVDKHETFSHGYCPDCFRVAMESVRHYACHAKFREKPGYADIARREM